MIGIQGHRGTVGTISANEQHTGYICALLLPGGRKRRYLCTHVALADALQAVRAALAEEPAHDLKPETRRT